MHRFDGSLAMEAQKHCPFIPAEDSTSYHHLCITLLVLWNWILEKNKGIRP
jgi:hypothetical protein